MKKIKQIKGWGIYKNNTKEIAEYGFLYTVLSPDNVEYAYLCSPADSDLEFNSIDDCVSHIQSI